MVTPLLRRVFAGARNQGPPARVEPAGDKPSCDEPVQPAGTLARVAPPQALDVAFAVPFGFVPAPLPAPRPIAVLAHLFYQDLTEELFSYLRNIPGPADIFLTTDTEEKRDAILRVLPDWSAGRVEVRVVPNRGRDIAPKLVGLADVHRRYDRVLHLHGKMSKHWHHGQNRRQYLYEVLLGSPDVVRSILAAFDADTRLGLVLPLHWDPVRPWVDWGFDYRPCRAFAGRLGVEVARDQPLEFPSGSMFWARTAALRPLLDLNLRSDHFPPEGFTGGRLAHVIERLYARACERSGHVWLKAARPDLSSQAAEITSIDSPGALRDFLEQKPYLLGDPALRLRPPAALPGPALPWPRWRFRPDRSEHVRLTLLAGSARGDIAKTGGALDIFRRVAAAWGGVPARVVGDETCLGAAHAAGLDHAERVSMPPAGPFPPPPLPIRTGEVLFAASWRDAVDACALADNQESFFGHRPKLVFLLLDAATADPAERLAEAEACRRSRDALAVLERPQAATRRSRAFARCEVLRPLWSPGLDAALSAPQPWEGAPLLLVDWQPSRPESLAGLAAAALGRWLEQDPHDGHQWTIIGVGEPGEDVKLTAGRTLSPCRPDTAEYAALLQRATLGLSVTLDGEPSRVALEMAACGVATVIAPSSNVSRIASGLAPAAGLDVESVAAALAAAARGVARRSPGRTGEAPPGFWAEADLDSLAHRIAAWISPGASPLDSRAAG